jgi:hypothetical protein
VAEEPVSLDIRCPHCGGELTIHCADWVQGGDVHQVELRCPFCRKPNVAGLPARQVLVTRRVAESRPH